MNEQHDHMVRYAESLVDFSQHFRDQVKVALVIVAQDDGTLVEHRLPSLMTQFNIYEAKLVETLSTTPKDYQAPIQRRIQDVIALKRYLYRY